MMATRSPARDAQRRQALGGARHAAAYSRPGPLAIDAAVAWRESDRARGCARARSSSRPGAVVRRSSSAEGAGAVRRLTHARDRASRIACVRGIGAGKHPPWRPCCAKSAATRRTSCALDRPSRQLMTRCTCRAPPAWSGRASAPARMLPSAMPARITCSKQRSMRRLLRPMRRRLASGR